MCPAGYRHSMLRLLAATGTPLPAAFPAGGAWLLMAVRAIPFALAAPAGRPRSDHVLSRHLPIAAPPGNKARVQAQVRLGQAGA